MPVITKENPTEPGLYWTKVKYSNSNYQTKFEYLDYFDGTDWYGTWTNETQARSEVISGDVTDQKSLCTIWDWKLYMLHTLVRNT